MTKTLVCIALSVGVGVSIWWMNSEPDPSQGPQVNLQGAPESIRPYLGLLSNDRELINSSLEEIRANWRPDSALLLTDVNRFHRIGLTQTKILKLRREMTKQDFNNDRSRWLKWIWSQEPAWGPDYALFKTRIHEPIDSRFAAYFKKTDNARIRLDQIVWGGVKRDGIPPLNNPKMISPKEATFLGPDNVVFGVVYNGEARCYPKRILA